MTTQPTTFKPGTRVVMVRSDDGADPIDGTEGTIVRHTEDSCLVAFDDFSGHTGEAGDPPVALCPLSNGWYVRVEQVRAID